MASLTSLPFLLLLFTALTAFTLTAGDTFRVDLHHRYSDKVRQWAESKGLPATWHPEKAPVGSVEYYKDLIRHDRALLSRRGRSLAATDVYTFAAGNETVRVGTLGNLHYALVTVGTPNQTFLVAMDTGSDLFWLPCNCKQCAPLTSPLYGNLEFSIFKTNESSTSKAISCGSSQCNVPTSVHAACTGTGSDCTYTINYASVNTSSSGFLVEDVLYLAKGDTGADIVQTPIVFGCGEVQTGSFLKSGAPNGLMGLGMDNLSVPTMLAKKGLTSDSFSMCFGADGSGRLNFGDKGSPDQSETPLIVDNYPFYNISLERMVIGNSSTKSSFTALVDSGTSFTILAKQIYQELTTTFTEQVTETQISDANLPFEFCYQFSSGQTKVVLPIVNLTTKGGSQFPVVHPIVYLVSETSQAPIGYCLAVLPSTNINIIGQNFLTGLRIVFDREKMVLGWKKFDCYNSETSTGSPIDKKASAPSPGAQAPSTLFPEATQLPGRKSWAPVLSPSTILSTAFSVFLMVFGIF
ncbi:Eukaryotic aspartyl protease family protein [Rhynchospora pubera]|uniref:Eukaryotic aspartyl protease family protein n=1 Tax=Rhynchospora pubera TaxID=906938 RepID=A0AAV8ECH1_9POAL|nr:Eukaryotic aspartyl protease family protein [Rhynchospora pubera]